MDKRSVIINRVFIAVFMAMICLPLLFFNHEEGKVSEIENKTLAQKPELYLVDGNLNASYISEFENYFNDNVGFKEEALAVNILAKYKLFGVLDIPNWLLGKDGNLFYTTGGEDIATYTGKNVYSEETMQQITENLGYMNQYFEQQGCTTYNMFIPNKEAVYSEVYNQDVYHAEISRLDLLGQYMEEHTDMNVINVKDALIDQKAEQLYFKSYDASHWNMNGAFVGYQELMSAIQKEHPNIRILNKDDFEITEEPFSGLMSYYEDISLIDDNFDFEDVVYTYNLKGGYHAVMDENPLGGREIDPNLNFYHFQNNVVGNGETLLIVGDSYMYCFLLTMLGESFEHVYFVRNTDADTIVELAKEIEPTIFVFEVAERVVNEAYFELMSGYQNYLNIEFDIEQYTQLAEISEFHIDVPAFEAGKLSVEDGSIVEILGWAFDTCNDIKPAMILAEVDGKYINAEFYYRDDLAQMGDKYGQCGFKICIPRQLIENVDEIGFYVITENNQVYEECKVTLEK